MLDLSRCMRRGDAVHCEIRTSCVFECVGRNQNIDVSSLMVYERRVNRVYWKVVDWMDNSPFSRVPVSECVRQGAALDVIQDRTTPCYSMNIRTLRHPDTPSSRPQHREGQIPGSLTELRKEMTSWTAERSPDSTFTTLTGECVCARASVCVLEHCLHRLPLMSLL